ncbi:FkbM family methyltransferase [Mycobacterium triplex]|uniref:Methyltransferase, FkbM family n=1 Tax=Mycobacterium triplex TaxID=47839 RepID=A0A024JYN3_9MYCO|nr:FkbM family methyltransferase [Mycobacterium triplex]CDO88363.1 methyltransferase, FkbM family [Mycobacterium triplex]
MGTVEAAYRLARRAIDRVHGYGVINRGGRGVVGLIDVGSVGPLPDPWHQRSDLVSHVLKFEPRDPRGEKPRVVTVDAALWSEPATLPFYIYSGQAGHGSSLFREDQDYVRQNFETLRTLGPPQLAETWFDRVQLDHIEEIQCTTLDAVLADRVEPYHVLKIDAQGAERQILEGAANYLAGGDCLALHLELFRLPLYRGITLRPEVQAMVDDLGFSLVKEFPPHGTFDSQNDCVFLRRGAGGPVADAIRLAYEL